MTNSFSCCWETPTHVIAKNWQSGLPSFHLGVTFSETSAVMDGYQVEKHHNHMFGEKKYSHQPAPVTFQTSGLVPAGNVAILYLRVDQMLIPNSILLFWKKWMPCCNFKTGVRVTSRITRNQKNQQRNCKLYRALVGGDPVPTAKWGLGTPIFLKVQAHLYLAPCSRLANPVSFPSYDFEGKGATWRPTLFVQLARLSKMPAQRQKLSCHPSFFLGTTWSNRRSLIHSWLQLKNFAPRNGSRKWHVQVIEPRP